jgi:hypothetical protein
MANLKIVIDIQDWYDEALKSETPITSTDDIINLLEKEISSGEIGRMTLAWREVGEAPADILQPNKLLLYGAARENVSRIARSRKHDIEVGGATYEAYDYVGSVREAYEDNGFEQSYVRYDNPKAQERSENYLSEIVPGHIWNRLLLLHESGGDVKAAGARLKREITRQVNKLV